jgi:hypothetical protein
VDSMMQTTNGLSVMIAWPTASCQEKNEREREYR